ncbi:MAG TPA: PorP/SprF family type IX secretion system membrane protein, partial [Saprospiraceae bacterium]|nr:PorP/SprF family type IX secretion system membrane protein [Saprospiraceae bacterium]
MTLKFLTFSLLSIIFTLCVFLHDLGGQDVAFSQFFNSPTLLNQAFVGNSSASSFSTTYRNQWPSINNAYTTYSVTVDKYFDELNSGFGLNIFSDNAGDGSLRTIRFDGLYSYKVKIVDNKFLRGGINMSFGQRRLDWERFIFYDALDPLLGNLTAAGTRRPTSEVPPDFFNINYLTLGTGLLYSDESWYLGLSFDNINQPRNSFYKTSPYGKNTGRDLKYSIHGGYFFPLIRDFRTKETLAFVSPNFMYLNHGGFSQINIGAYSELTRLIVGGSYRYATSNTDAIIAMFGFSFDYFKMIYSFDYNIGSVGIKSGGAHELG